MIMPPTYFIVGLLLSILFHFIMPIIKVIPSPYNYIGIMLILFGIMLNVWADSMFKKRKTTVKPHKMPRHLEIAGPFKISRNPMYLGMFLILFGVSILMGSVSTFIFPVVFFILMEDIFIRVEEANCENVFGKKYLEYKKKVRRWI